MSIEPFEVGDDLNNFLLFNKLKEKLGTDCILPATRAKATESRAHLNEAIEKYFRNFIIMDIVSSRRSTLSKETSSQTLEEGSVPSHPLHLNAFKMHLQQSGISGELKCQGIDEEFVSNLLSKKKENSLQLTKDLELGIKEFCNTISKYSNHSTLYKHNVSDGGWLKSFKGFVKEQESQLASLEAERAMIESSKKTLNRMILTYYEELFESISILTKLLSLHEKKLLMENNFSQFFALKFRALYLKAKIIQLEVLEKTYTEESIPALREIKARSEEKREHVSKEIEDKRLKLRAYKILGPEYENLVAEYSQLKTDIARLKWSMKSLEEGLKD